MKKFLKNNYLFVLIGVALIIVGAFFIYSPSTAPVTYENTYVPPPYNPFDDITISAKSAVVYDVNSSNFIYEKNSSTSRPLASVTKLMTAYTANSLLRSTSTIKIEFSDLETDGDSGLIFGESWSYADLRDIMLVASSNDAAEAISRTATSSFVKLMNQLAKESSWSSFSFKNPSGLDQNNILATAFGNARDVAFLMKALMRKYPETLESTRETSINRKAKGAISKTFKNTNVTINEIPTLLGSKTGFTDSAGGNVAVAYNIGLNRPIIIVVLGSFDRETRFSDLETLVKTTELYLETH